MRLKFLNFKISKKVPDKFEECKISVNNEHDIQNVKYLNTEKPCFEKHLKFL